MRRRSSGGLLSAAPECSAWALAGLLLSLLPGQSAGQKVLLSGATLLDGLHEAPVEDSRVLIVDGRFSCVSGPTGCPAGEGVDSVDLRGMWLTPGWIDTHVHLNFRFEPAQAARDQAVRFALGITTVREAGLQYPEALGARDAATDGSAPEPRLSLTGLPNEASAARIGVPRGPDLIRRFHALGVDGIKLKDPLPDGVWLSEVRAAVELGLPVWGHTWNGPPPVDFTSQAIEAGLTGVSHLQAFAPAAQPGSEAVEAPVAENDPGFYEWRKGLWTTADTSKLSARIEEMIAAGVWLEPLLATEYYWGRSPAFPSSLAYFERNATVLAHLFGRRRATSVPRPTYPEAYQRMARFVEAFASEGGLVVAGSDNLQPGMDLHLEVRLLREAGLSPRQSLRAVTSGAALALGRSDLGAIEPGRLGDAVVFSADPLRAPGNSLRISHVVKGGRVHASSDLTGPFRNDLRARRIRLGMVASAFGVLLGLLALMVIWVRSGGIRS